MQGPIATPGCPVLSCHGGPLTVHRTARPKRAGACSCSHRYFSQLIKLNEEDSPQTDAREAPFAPPQVQGGGAVLVIVNPSNPLRRVLHTCIILSK